jgi:Sec-independent protein translocase protein TatA
MVVLIFFGPKSIPGIAKTLGKALFTIRNASTELQNEIKKSGMDIKKDINIDDILKREQKEMLQPMDQVFSEINNTVHFEASKTVSTEEMEVKTTDSEENATPLKWKKVSPKRIVRTKPTDTNVD